MTALAAKIAEQALELPGKDRAELVEVLMRSLTPPASKDVGQLWAQEAENRVQEIEDGKVDLLDGEEVLQEIREHLER